MVYLWPPCGIVTKQSEEDQLLKDMLDMAVKRVSASEEGVQKLAIESLRNEIRSATSSMTSVPKPLKFLREHYAHLVECMEVGCIAYAHYITVCASRHLWPRADPAMHGHVHVMMRCSSFLALR